MSGRHRRKYPQSNLWNSSTQQSLYFSVSSLGSHPRKAGAGTKNLRILFLSAHSLLFLRYLWSAYYFLYIHMFGSVCTYVHVEVRGLPTLYLEMKSFTRLVVHSLARLANQEAPRSLLLYFPRTPITGVTVHSSSRVGTRVLVLL